MAPHCVLKNLPCAFLTFTIHYTFPIDHTLDLITLTVFYKDWILCLITTCFHHVIPSLLGLNFLFSTPFFNTVTACCSCRVTVLRFFFFHVTCACRQYSSDVSATKLKCFRRLVTVNTTSCPRIQKPSSECFKWAYYCKATTSNFK